MHETIWTRRPVARLGAWLLIATAVVGFLAREAPTAGAQEPASLESLLPGVDPQRLAAAAEVWDDPPSRDSIEAAAKLLWALARIDPATERPHSQPHSQPRSPLRVVRVRGAVTHYETVRIPPELAEVLEFDRLYRVQLEQATAVDANVEGELPTSIGVVARQLPAAWLSAASKRNAGAQPAAGVGQTVEFTALSVESGKEEGGGGRRLYANRLGWYPQANGSGDRGELPLGWQLLAAEGVDIGRLTEVASRNRKPLEGEDSDTFYALLAAAAALSGDPGQPAPERVETMQMLRSPAELAGHWIRLDLETARLSRIAVTTPERRAQLGRDAYWQIDAFGELRGAKVQLESPDGEGESLVFETRFPVSLAILELPEWLERRVESDAGEGAIAVSMLSESVTVDGFFFRLWSYDSEYAESRGGRQIGPLVVASEIELRPANVALERGVSAIGWLLAAVVLGSLLLTAVVLWRVGRRDRAVARERRAAAAQRPPTPPESW